MYNQFNKLSQYLFCYGSLLNSKSRFKTLQKYTQTKPYILKGYKRDWCFHSDKHKMTALGIYKHKYYDVNGIIIPVNDNDLKLLDEREKGYKRILVDANCIWTYVVNDIQLPNEKYPIKLSYKKLVIDGFLENKLKIVIL